MDVSRDVRELSVVILTMVRLRCVNCEGMKLIMVIA